MSENTSANLKNVLDKYGLICHTFAYDDLSKDVQANLCNENKDNFNGHYLSLIANVGPTFWSALIAQPNTHQLVSRTAEMPSTNHVDLFSLNIAEQLLQVSGLAGQAEILYPGTAPAPLIQLGESARWSSPSPLGLGLHAKYGPWFAYRALIKTTKPLQDNIAEQTRGENTDNVSPCLTCDSTPCVTACPADAVAVNVRFNIGQCADYRVSDTSTCNDRCHARNACPHGIEYQYSDEQHAYHMRHALQALVNWAAKT